MVRELVCLPVSHQYPLLSTEYPVLRYQRMKETSGEANVYRQNPEQPRLAR